MVPRTRPKYAPEPEITIPGDWQLTPGHRILGLVAGSSPRVHFTRTTAPRTVISEPQTVNRKAMPQVCIISVIHPALDNRIFWREACSLRRAGYMVTLLAVHPREEEVAGIRILPVAPRPRWRRPWLWGSVVRRALATRADLYLFHNPELLLIAPWLRFSSGRPVVYDVHECTADFMAIKEDFPAWIRRPLAWLLRWLEPALARGFTDGLIFADDEIATSFRQFAGPRTTLFNFPLPELVEQAAAASWPTEQRPPAIIYLGGVKRHRGAMLMLAALARVREQMPTARLLLVGPFLPAALEPEFRAEMVRLQLTDAVTITGAVPFTEIGDWLRQAAIGWIPFPDVVKYRKNIPTKLFEYLAYGLPVVGSDLPPVRQFLVPGETGLLVSPEDPAAHAEALLSLLADPARAVAMGRRGQQQVAAEWTWPVMETRLLAFARQVREAQSEPN